MGRSKKKTLFLGVRPIGGPAIKSRRVARKVTTQYHALIEERSQIEQTSSLTLKEQQKKLKDIEERLKNLGGINRYQEASVVSTKHFSTSKWIIQTIRQLLPFPPTTSTNTTSTSTNTTSTSTISTSTSSTPATQPHRWNTLEIGAINTQLQQASFLNVRSIDLHSQHALIEEKDFFEILPEQSYDVVVCSMVINYVTDPMRRGEMIGRLCQQLSTRREGDGGALLFLILPKRCLSSPFFSSLDDFQHLLEWVFGLTLCQPVHFTPKVAFFVLRLSSSTTCHSNSTSCWQDVVRQRIEESIVQYGERMKENRNLWRKILLSSNTNTKQSVVAPVKNTSSDEELDTEKTRANDFSIYLPTEFVNKKTARLLKSILD
eukprot:gene5582-6145_t